MLKKHIVPFAVVATLFILAKVFAYQMPLAQKSLLKEEKLNTTIPKSDSLEVESAEKPLSLMAQLNFAKETLPLGDKKVERKMKKILAAHTYGNTQTNKLHAKAAKWFPVIEPILAAYGIPNDFKYLALVESGMAEGVSPKGAAGIWQFMPGTARTYGLRVNGNVDERYNLRKSTIAACKYIKEMYKGLESWTLVAAAYNVGDGRLRKQINNQNQDNYYKMKLNRETGGYVYKVISMKQIMEHPKRYGYEKPRVLLAYNAE
ncbi:lytic transglycosylase domain-containing protein [Pedobacter sp. ISL-68]|uniref:lytic transglycosylase domain-containing protein n=1 Tax=unclassified Pedobacter TaxID=2628915 RepID=UPI001BEAB81E|nr:MULTISPECIES: lytic transglycosylase domain-containing protein [unclassified Pedobacter]MBT2560384.1 lytic transglycosylase domain-containing protein [Pedobacter sp. ISL-64]MBT2589364.1 lytic transglycosylase domain-containing protein [Pedobacter sp. ISL-68]